MNDSLEIRPVSVNLGRLACRHWHYSGKLPSTRYIFGFYRGATFDGIIAFRPNFAHRDTQKYWVGVFGSPLIAELCRIALRPQGERPPTTRYLSLALGKMRELGFEGIGTYADGGIENRETGVAHTGGVYRAGSWVYLGMSRDTEIYYEGGRWLHAHNFSDGRPYPRIFKSSHKYRFAFPLSRRARRALREWADAHTLEAPRGGVEGGPARRARYTGRL